MADKKISALTAATTPLAGTEVLPIVQGGVTVKVPVSDLTAGRGIAASAATLTGASAAISLTLANSGGGTNATLAVTENTGVTLNLNEGATKRQLIIQQGGAEVWRLNSVSNLAAQAGFGVDFSGNTPAAGMTSQLLNWYEEGTWTPSQGAGLTVFGTFSSSGTYTKVGRQVTVNGLISATTSVACASGSAMCAGLPFAVSGGGSAGTYFNGALSEGGVLDAYSSSVYAIGAINTTGAVYFTITYFV